MIFFPISPWAIVIVLLIIVVCVGLQSKWWPLVMFIIILFVYKSCEQYEEDWCENGHLAPKTEKEQNYETYIEDSLTITSDYDYYPMKSIDQTHPDSYCSPNPSNAFWEKGYRAGAADGVKDYEQGTPYASYDFEGYYPRQKGSTWRHGYWVGYSFHYPGLKRLTDEEVLEMYKKSKYYNP